jgi:hypothetical protein
MSLSLTGTPARFHVHPAKVCVVGERHMLGHLAYGVETTGEHVREENDGENSASDVDEPGQIKGRESRQSKRFSCAGLQ